MARKRKTIAVEDVKEIINGMIGATPPEFVLQRQALAIALERVLHDTGNYRGFQFTDGARGDIDESRRRYA